MRKLVSLLVLAGMLGVALAVGGDIIVKDLKLYVNCEEFIIKGMCYNPAPLGLAKMNADQTGGAGLCSTKKTPWGDWKSACYDSDYFDGSASSWDRWPQGPNSWFRSLWERDFPVMKELGINTIRLYNANPTTLQYTEKAVGTNGIAYPLGKEHVQFMDLAAQYGFKVIFPLVGDQTILTTQTEDTVKQYLRNQIDEVGNHSALIMWNFSNELPLASDPSLVQLLNKYIAYIKQYTVQRWNRQVPVTAAVVDIPSGYNSLMATLNVDIFSSNAGYRGLDFQDLWSGDRTPGFSGFYNLSMTYNKPLFVSEIGWHTENNAITYAIPDWFNQIYADLVKHIDQGCIGGAFFEYNDEPNKTDILQQTMGVVNFTVAVDATGKRSDQVDAFIPDAVNRKDIIFNALKQGTFQGKNYNFNEDIYNLMGRSQTKLSASECVVTPSTTGSVTPSSTSGVVSGSVSGSSNNGVSTSSGSVSGTQTGAQTGTQTGTQQTDQTGTVPASTTDVIPTPTGNSQSTSNPGATSGPIIDQEGTTGVSSATSNAAVSAIIALALYLTIAL